MRSPSSSSVTAPPSPLSSAASAASRSVSWWRMCPMPVNVLGPSANAASATRLGTSSPASERSRSTPRMPRPPSAPGSGARTVSRSASIETRAPKRGRISASWAPTWVVSAGQPVIVTCPPATSAATRNGAAFERSGSMSTSTARIGPGSTCHRPGSGLVDLDAACGEGRDRHLDVRQARQALADVAQVEAPLEPRRREQQARHELARRRRVDLERSALDPTRAVHGEREGAAAVVVEVDAERAAGPRSSRPSADGGRPRRRRTSSVRARAPRPAGGSA